jgi:hypothetical protein
MSEKAEELCTVLTALKVEGESAEAQQLKGQITLVTGGLSEFQYTIKRTSGSHSSLISNPEAYDRLMKRLKLETSVNSYRWRLEFMENHLAKLVGN